MGEEREQEKENNIPVIAIIFGRLSTGYRLKISADAVQPSIMGICISYQESIQKTTKLTL